MDVVRNRLRSQRQWSPQRESSRPTMQNVRSAAEYMIDERPVIAALAAFGIGLGLGTAIGVMIADWVFESMDTRSDFEKITQNVMDRVSSMVPEAVARHFHR